MIVPALAAFAARALLVMLFLPFSALDKLVDFWAAVAQAKQVCKPRWLAVLAILTGLAIELLGSLAVLTGVLDLPAALLLAIYCLATALMFKRFWAAKGSLRQPDSESRTLFWDFFKNISVAGGFLLIVVGSDGLHLASFLDNPLASTLYFERTSQ